jgi:uncharacterized membrane protein
VLATLTGATTPPPSGFSFTNVIVLVLVVAVLYPVQKKIRDSVSRHRRERWAREEDVARERLEHRDDELPPT